MVGKKHEAKKAIQEKKAEKPLAKKKTGKESGAVKEERKHEKQEVKAEKKVDKEQALRAYEVLLHPLITEKAINLIESENKLVFIVKGNASRPQVKKAVEDLYSVKVDNVNILRDSKARKRAFVKINEKFKADEIATKLGVL